MNIIIILLQLYGKLKAPMPKEESQSTFKGLQGALSCWAPTWFLHSHAVPKMGKGCAYFFLETIKQLILHICIVLRTQLHNQVPCYLAVPMISQRVCVGHIQRASSLHNELTVVQKIENQSSLLNEHTKEKLEEVRYCHGKKKRQNEVILKINLLYTKYNFPPYYWMTD